MNYIRTVVTDIDSARASVPEYDYALVCMMSELRLCSTAGMKPIDWEECLELRCFSADRELHMFSDDGEWHAVITADSAQAEENDASQLLEYQLPKKHDSVGTCLQVKEYLTADMDGQAVVTATRLCGIRKGE